MITFSLQPYINEIKAINFSKHHIGDYAIRFDFPGLPKDKYVSKIAREIKGLGADLDDDNNFRKFVIINYIGYLTNNPNEQTKFYVPFYLSTGKGGKKNVQAGKWYPFFGVGSDGWLNKGSEQEINNYYGCKSLKKISNELDSTIGDVRYTEYLSGRRFPPVFRTNFDELANYTFKGMRHKDYTSEYLRRCIGQVRELERDYHFC